MEPKDPDTYAIIGAAMEVHRVLGCGFAESAYQEALAIELQIRIIPFRREVPLEIEYKGQKLNTAVGLLLNFGARSLESKRMVGASNYVLQPESVKSVKSVESVD